LSDMKDKMRIVFLMKIIEKINADLNLFQIKMPENHERPIIGFGAIRFMLGKLIDDVIEIRKDVADLEKKSAQASEALQTKIEVLSIRQIKRDWLLFKLRMKVWYRIHIKSRASGASRWAKAYKK